MKEKNCVRLLFWNQGYWWLALQFQVEIRTHSFGFHASIISYKSLDQLPFSSLMGSDTISPLSPKWGNGSLSISLAWHWINLSHTKVHLLIRLLSTPPFTPIYFISLSFLSVLPIPCFSPVQLTVIVSEHIASCLFIPCFSSVLPTPDYAEITLQPVKSGMPVSRWYHVRKHLHVHNDLQQLCTGGSVADTVSWINLSAFRQNRSP